MKETENLLLHIMPLNSCLPFNLDTFNNSLFEKREYFGVSFMFVPQPSRVVALRYQDGCQSVNAMTLKQRMTFT